ncbi:MAG: hypothetical protein QOD09_3851 [Bradyrhizobium sp.]|jgi:hypothetical protein|nr:hypothetical protein [Bradyrhizobium sp.]
MAAIGPAENAVELEFGDARVRSGFRFTEASELAGGPVELEFFVELIGSGSRYLLVAADRMRRRPSDVSFAATFAGVPLADPGKNVPDMGGPAGVVEIAAGRPWRQPLILNQFIGLEAVLDMLEPGGSGPLTAACRRPLPLAIDEAGALAPAPGAPIVEVQLTLKLRRDDAALGILIDQLVAQIRDGAPEQRPKRLDLLLALRAPAAVNRWRALVNHPDPAVAQRVRQSLSKHGH